MLDAKIESNVNQYKVDRMNAEISAFSSGELNKYEFLTRKDLKYRPNASDKARFQFSPLGQTFSIGLDKTTQGYEIGVMKLLKDIRDVLRGGIRQPGPDNDHDDNDNDDNDDNDNNNDDHVNDDNDNDDKDNDDKDKNKFSEYQEVISSLIEEIDNNKIKLIMIMFL